MNDNSIMPFGKYKGTKLINVPASYLLWLYSQWTETTQLDDNQKELKEYIEDNMKVLEMELKQEKKKI
jgi:uncharacterized protein (DUF3820 family)